MIAVLLTLIAVFIVLVLSELGWRYGHMTSEVGRKFVHITVGSYVAFWPFYLSWNEIRLLSLGFFIVVLISKYLNVFQAIHSVQRPTYGEIFFALVVGLLTFVTRSKGIYAAALLQMSAADGMAAVIGVEYGLKHFKYHIFGHTKTVLGTLSFFVVSLIILFGFSMDSKHLAPELIVGLAAAATGLENIGIAGFDNLFVPLLVGLVLAHVR